ncbi:hypothetical protein [Pseudomonas sp. F01002]|uniref:hypothetical protein n=1 Tax=Pseudomonas sp. F01002 TaxID=2555724 RepID=UPI00106D2C2F|nr:hypothetical protein [Pseudomonas sp. F01002]TFB37311.1 hypothetical protein E3W21_21525 [Pseudomonas sp. F01002]
MADAYTYRNGAIAEEFLDLVVRPSVAALERKHLELASSDNLAIAGFAASDHRDLIDKTNMAFCLSIQSLWEQQLRRYLGHCVGSLGIEGVTADELEHMTWGEKTNKLFQYIRGTDLTAFDSYVALNKLQLLGNACRHGAGKSLRQLLKLHPELWPQHDTSQTPHPVLRDTSIQSVQISVGLLAAFVDAIVLFWMDMEILGLESFANEDARVVARIAYLRNSRESRLA